MKFAHIRLWKNNHLLTNGGYTFCYRWREDGRLEYSRANCSLKDNYCKKIGRMVALGRMTVGKTVISDVPPDTKIVDFLLDNEGL